MQQPLIDNARTSGQHPEESARPGESLAPHAAQNTVPPPAPGRPTAEEVPEEVRTGAARAHRAATGTSAAL